MKKAILSNAGSRLVSGNSLDRTACVGQQGVENDGAVFSLDVSHLWHGRLYWPFVTAFEENSHYLPGRDLHDWNFCRRIRNRYVFETL